MKQNTAHALAPKETAATNPSNAGRYREYIATFASDIESEAVLRRIYEYTQVLWRREMSAAQEASPVLDSPQDSKAVCRKEAMSIKEVYAKLLDAAGGDHDYLIEVMRSIHRDEETGELLQKKTPTLVS